MASTTFVDRQTPIMASWLNDVDDVIYAQAKPVSYYGAIGDGVTNDRAALQAAIDSNQSLHFGDKTYNVGNLSGGEYALLSTRANKITYSGNPKFICTTTDTTQPGILVFNDFTNVTLSGSWEFQDLGFSTSGAGVGARAIGLLTTAQNSTNFKFDIIKGTNVIAGLVCATLDLAYTVKGVVGGLIEVRDGYYGLNCANSGDNLNIAKIITHNCKRSYFVYGVDGHVFDVESNGHAAGGFRDILINVSTKSTRNIKGKVVFKSSANNEYNVAIINASNPAATYVMENIDIEYDDLDSSNTNLYGFAVISSVPNSSAPETIATNTFNNLKFRGATRLLTGVTISSTLTNQCTLQVDKALWNPAATNDRTNGIRIEDGEWLMAADYGDVNGVTFNFVCSDSRLFIRRFKMTIIDNQADGNSATYDHRYVNGIIRGFNTSSGGPVIVHATTEYDNTAVGSPGTYAVAGSGENLQFTFSGWSGSTGGRVRVWVEK
jgi:hypothetical protein